MTSRPGLRVIVPTLLGCWIALAQVLSFAGLAIWVITGSVLTAWVILSVLSQRRLGMALVIGLVTTLLLTGLAEKLGGSDSGPVTRATLMAVGATVAMALITQTRYPSWILLPSAMLLAGALGLGAAGHAAWLVAAWVPLSCISLLIIGPYSGRDLSKVARRHGTALMIAGSGLVAALLLGALGWLFATPWSIDGSGIAIGAHTEVSAVTTEVDRAPDGASPDLVTPPGDASSAPAAVAANSPTAADTEPLRPPFLRWWVVVTFWLAVIAALLIVGLCVERIWIWLRWRALRARLRRRAPAESMLGSWEWMRLRLARAGHPLAAPLSPDVAAGEALSLGDDELAWLARHVCTAAYEPSTRVTRREARRAWRIAGSRARAAHTRGLIGAVRRSGQEPPSRPPSRGSD